MNNKFKKVRMMMAFCMMAVLCFGNLSAFAETPKNSVVIEVQQVFEAKGTDKEIEGEFTYELTAVGGTHTDAPLPDGAENGKYTFTVKGNNSNSIVIKYNVAGEYVYNLKQVKEDPVKKGYIYDDEEYVVRVYMINGNQGLEPRSVTIQQTVKGKEKIEKALFTCGYQPEKYVLETDPPVKKAVNVAEGATKPEQDATFEFVLKAENPENPMPEGAANGEKTVTVVGEGTTEFGIWEYTAAGTYVYTVSEKNTAAQGYVYDATVYTITDTVTDNEGQLALSRVVKDSSGKEITGIMEFAFENKYDPNGGGNNNNNNNNNNGGEGKEGGIFGPKTGDFFNNKPLMITVFGGAAVAVAAVCWIVIAKRKNREE